MHFVVSGAGLARKMETLTLCRRAGAGSDSAYARLPWMVKLPTDGLRAYVLPSADGGYRCAFQLHVPRSTH